MNRPNLRVARDATTLSALSRFWEDNPCATACPLPAKARFFRANRVPAAGKQCDTANRNSQNRERSLSPKRKRGTERLPLLAFWAGVSHTADRVFLAKRGRGRLFTFGGTRYDDTLRLSRKCCARIIHSTLLTRSASEGWETSCPRLRFGFAGVLCAANTGP